MQADYCRRKEKSWTKMGFWSWKKNEKGVKTPFSAAHQLQTLERTNEHTFHVDLLPLSSFHLKSIHPQPAFNDFFWSLCQPSPSLLYSVILLNIHQKNWFKPAPARHFRCKPFFCLSQFLGQANGGWKASSTTTTRVQNQLTINHFRSTPSSAFHASFEPSNQSVSSFRWTGDGLPNIQIKSSRVSSLLLHVLNWTDKVFRLPNKYET